jgi:YidC/Oxa1 family membrane protein insertase
MDQRRLVLFLVLSFAILGIYSWISPPAAHSKKKAVATAEKPEAKEVKKEEAKKPAEETKKPAETAKKSEEKAEAKKPLAEKKDEKKPATMQAAPDPDVPEQWVTLGSADRNQPYRMLVTLTNKGAAVARIELNSPQYCDVDHRNGYLGHLVMDRVAAIGKKGCIVQVVGPGTPAAEAGLMPGDVIMAIGDKPVSDPAGLEAILGKTKPKQTIELFVERDGKPKTLTAKLRRCPLEVVKPEADDPLSMLLTLQRFDDQKLGLDVPKFNPDSEEYAGLSDADKQLLKDKQHTEFLNRELKGVKLRDATWKLVSSDATTAQFRRVLPDKGLEVLKTYRLTKVDEASLKDPAFPAYHLEFDIEIRNVGGDAHEVAYRLDGPNGLPTEGKWYASRVSRNWGGSGLRDFIISFGGTPGMVGSPSIATGSIPAPWTEAEKMMSFIGVDAQYFSAVLMPQRQKANEAWFESLTPLCVGKVDPQHLNLVNSSCRLIGTVKKLEPGESISNRFLFFAGPKQPQLLANKEYNLEELIYFGWPIFAMVARPLTSILHSFYSVTGNYGLAIILLTILVRGAMFPLSLKQAAGAQKMQMLQPEIKKLTEKYKNNIEARQKAQQELFRKHNYNPLAGCLPVFIQMPVFIGLYRSLMVAIELRDAPLISNSIRWCSNLAAPDMLYDWHLFIPAFINSGVGIFGLGPYFNLLPVLTIILFIVQQKMFMPPATDEQTAMQQKIMQYMMVFMGLMFFKVASGLCIYFIASSLWGLAERKFLPKTTPVASGSPETRADVKARDRASQDREKKK